MRSYYITQASIQDDIHGVQDLKRHACAAIRQSHTLEATLVKVETEREYSY